MELEDAELHDEQDPEYREEMFRSFKEMGWTPEDIKDPVYREQYREWLKK